MFLGREVEGETRWVTVCLMEKDREAHFWGGHLPSTGQRVEPLLCAFSLEEKTFFTPFEEEHRA